MELLIWDQEDGWGARVWKKKLINKKYFPPECVFLFQDLKGTIYRRLTNGVRDVSATLKHKFFEWPSRGQMVLGSKT